MVTLLLAVESVAVLTRDGRYSVREVWVKETRKVTSQIRTGQDGRWTEQIAANQGEGLRHYGLLFFR